MPKIARTFTTLHTQLHTSCRPKIPQSVACPTSTGITLGSDIGQQIALPETDKSPVKMNGWKMRCPFDLLDLLRWPIFRGCWGYFSFRAGTWQEKRAKVQNPQRSINISRMPELTYYTRLHYVLRVETWTPHLPSRCAQHPSNISGKSEGEVMPAAISPAWKQVKETTQGLSPSILSFLSSLQLLPRNFTILKSINLSSQHQSSLKMIWLYSQTLQVLQGWFALGIVQANVAN